MHKHTTTREAITVRELSPDTLADLVKTATLEALAAHEAAKPQTETLLSAKQACALLGVCKQTLWGWRAKGLVPTRKVGGRVFYEKAELLSALRLGPRGKGRRNLQTEGGTR